MAEELEKVTCDKCHLVFHKVAGQKTICPRCNRRAAMPGSPNPKDQIINAISWGILLVVVVFLAAWLIVGGNADSMSNSQITKRAMWISLAAAVFLAVPLYFASKSRQFINTVRTGAVAAYTVFMGAVVILGVLGAVLGAFFWLFSPSHDSAATNDFAVGTAERFVRQAYPGVKSFLSDYHVIHNQDEFDVSLTANGVNSFNAPVQNAFLVIMRETKPGTLTMVEIDQK